MSFLAVQHVLDAMAKSGALRGEWAYLVWLARNADNTTLQVTRSQERIAEELGITSRQVRKYQSRWLERGVIEVVHRGGSRMKLASKYAINLDMMAVFLGEKATPEPKVPEFPPDATNLPSKFRSSGGTPELSGRNSGTPGVPAIRSYSDQKKTDLGSAAEPSLAGASSSAPTPEAKAASIARARAEIAELRRRSPSGIRNRPTTDLAERVRKARKHVEADPSVGDDVLAKSYQLTPQEIREVRNL